MCIHIYIYICCICMRAPVRRCGARPCVVPGCSRGTHVTRCLDGSGRFARAGRLEDPLAVEKLAWDSVCRKERRLSNGTPSEKIAKVPPEKTPAGENAPRHHPGSRRRRGGLAAPARSIRQAPWTGFLGPTHSLHSRPPPSASAAVWCGSVCCAVLCRAMASLGWPSVAGHCMACPTLTSRALAV